MARSFPLIALASTLAVFAVACSGDRDPPAAPRANDESQTPVAATPAALPPVAASTTPMEGPPPLAFNCDGGARVDIGPLAASVRLSDGRQVKLARDPQNAFRFRGEALEFRMRGTSGELAQDEGVRSACRVG